MSKCLVPHVDVNVKTCYHTKPVGNSPEFIPMDNSLNTDITQSHDKHVALTRHLPKDDWREFCNRTSKSIRQGIKQMVKTDDSGCPRSEHVMQDCDKALGAMYTVYNVGGAIVPA